MGRITLSAARRRLLFRADEISCYYKAFRFAPNDTYVVDGLVGHAEAAWSIALKLPSNIVAKLVAEAR